MVSAAQHWTCIDASYSSACCLARAALYLHSQLSIDYQGSPWASTITALSTKLQCHLPSMRSSWPAICLPCKQAISVADSLFEAVWHVCVRARQ